MATPSVELTLASYEAFLRGDLDRLVARYHPDCEWDISRYESWGGDVRYHGRDRLRRFHADWTSTFDDLHATPSGWPRSRSSSTGWRSLTTGADRRGPRTAASARS